MGFNVRSRSWEAIFAQYEERRPYLADFVAWLRDSKYAHGLFGVTSVDTLVIGQTPEFDFHRNVIRIDEGGDYFRIAFVESVRSSSEREVERSDLIPAFEKLLLSLHWFIGNENGK